MDVLLQGLCKLRPNDAVPSPTDGKTGVAGWWGHLASQEQELRLAGFTANCLPPVLKPVWRDQFAREPNGSYMLRGTEITLEGKVTNQLGLLPLVADKTRLDLVLAPLEGSDKVQWNFSARSNQPLTAEENSADHTFRQYLQHYPIVPRSKSLVR